MKKSIFVLLFMFSAIIAQQTKTSSILKVKLNRITKNEKVKVWIYFTDKGNNVNNFLKHPELVVSKKSLLRRAKTMDKNSLIDFRDVPVSKNYIKTLSSYNITIHHRSRWFNAVSAYADKNGISQIEHLSFIKKIDLVRSFSARKKDIKTTAPKKFKQSLKKINSFDYGSSYTQLQQIDVPAVHDLGFYGQGVTICIMDAGFNNLEHPVFANMNIIAAYDFVNNDSNVDDEGDMGEGSHGTETLSTIGGFSEGHLIGPAFGASFILAKTENTDSETPAEEDNWIAAAEWADSIGVDVTSTSLGYIEMDAGFTGYTWQDMDGNTATITNGADLAAARGIVVVNSAGNEGSNSSHNTLGAPADGDSVIAVGAVGSSGDRVSFSSVGPTVDGRIKPDIMAMGSGVVVASPGSGSGYTSSSGTSFSCPLSAGVAALVVCANPNLTPMQVRDALRETASQHSNPDSEYGWGIIDALAAVNYFRVQISHQPLTDTENQHRLNVVNAEFSSTLPLDENSLYVYYSTDNFVTADSVQFTFTGSGTTYSATIPQSQNSTVEYYIKAGNSSGAASFLPIDAPSNFFKFTVGPDHIAPIVFHIPISIVSLLNFPINIEITAFDNITIDSTIVSYKINNNNLNSFNLSNIGDSTFSAEFPIAASEVSVGDSISYRIIVTDAANTPNLTILPTDSTFYTFTIGEFQSINENFDITDGNLQPTSDWEWGEVTINPPGTHSAPNVWGTVLNNDYNSTTQLSSLETPEYTVFGETPTLTFWHWYDSESTFDGGNVKISINNNPFQLIIPQSGYDSQLSSSFQNPIGGEEAFSGTSGGWKEVTFNLVGLVQGNDVVKFRFDFGADESIVSTGWYIDDLSLTDIGSPVTDLNNTNNSLPTKFELKQNYPNPFNPSTIIKYSIPNVETGYIPSVQLKVYDILGREIAILVNKKQTAGNYEINFDASSSKGEFANGVYIYRLSAVGKNVNFMQAKKMVLLR